MTNLKVKKAENHTYTVVNTLGDCKDQIFPKVHMEIDQQSSLADHLYAFERFLQAIGFILPEDSHIDFVENE